MLDNEEKQRIEIEYWRDSVHESPESQSIYNIVNKASDAQVFLDCLSRHSESLSRDGRVLELGAGQGWASCVYKNVFPHTEVIATDISEFAIASVFKWERLFSARLDGAYPCTSYDINEADGSLDQVFCFAAAHHFLKHRRTLLEISRVLKEGGKAFYFHEPATPRIWYPLVYRWVNSNRPEVPEDVLITSEIARLADEAGLTLNVDYYPSLLKRGAFETLYFYILGLIPFMQKLLPCSVILVFTKKGAAQTA